MSQQRVAITGLGVICAIGANTVEMWDSLSNGRPGIGPLTLTDTARLRINNVAEVHGYDPSKHFTPAQNDHIDRFAQFALIAAREASRDSGIVWTDELRERAAHITAALVGGGISADERSEDLSLRRK